jgi:hypothetical protein
VLEEVSRGVAAHPALDDVLAADWLMTAQLDPSTRSGISRYGRIAQVPASVT